MSNESIAARAANTITHTYTNTHAVPITIPIARVRLQLDAWWQQLWTG